jgi:hypothetical protein
MKYLTLCIAIIFSSCSSQKIFKTLSSADFKTAEQPYFESWTGGAPGSGSGVTLYFPSSILEGHSLQAVYFQGMENAGPSLTSTDKQMLVTRFQLVTTPDERNLDPKNEYGNEAPPLEDSPFKLLKNQAVIAFDLDGATQYVKLVHITQRETIVYPSAPPQGNNK